MLALLRTRRFAPLFLTQLLGALNDNLFKAALVVMLTVGTAERTSISVETLVNLASALLILPFFLFSALAGTLADKLEKARLIRALKLIEVAVMLVAAAGFHLGSLPLLFGSLFLMGAQSAFFGPLKYAILPQHLEARELVGGNALVETGTFIAILAGTLVGGLIVALDGIGVTAISATIVVIALLGWLASRHVPEASPSASHVVIDWNLARGTVRNLRLARANRPAFRAILGASWFWFLGALLLAQLPLIATAAIGGDERTISVLLAVFSVGIGVGSVLCERLSRGRIELGLVAPASLALTILLFDLAGSVAAAPGDGQIPLRLALDLLGLGLAGGVFVVPLYALMQERSASEERSRIVGANNIVNAAFMVGAAGFGIALSALGASAAHILAAGAALSLVATCVTAALTRDFVMRLVAGRLVRAIYRVRTDGLEHLPDHGPALLVANHVTYTDALVLGGLCRRPVRFVVYHRIYSQPLLRWFFRLVRAIPIAPKSEDPAQLARALEEIDLALAEGEIVGIFPEGKLTRDGELDEFRPGIERILAARPVPVVPVALRGLWGSFFSYAGGAPLRKWPRRLWSRIEIVFGRSVAPASASAEHLRAPVAALRGPRR
jgi:1-acyl-sn-glycerol-3-phosphate acyltransferase